MRIYRLILLSALLVFSLSLPIDSVQQKTITTNSTEPGGR
ncbi:hypothetical protein SAMN05444972_11919 [Marininema halotolerans]|uniref:Uncharacterized protein n=1 Tax=Marininema halotolerans TaxID=1155944 RepID=A0A1I6UR47_9BACL|nr:hypothetical protein SAMN05444972_11919 [Marininema halotolerans]